MRKYYCAEFLFCGTVRHYVSQNIFSIAGTLRLNRFSLLYVFKWLIFTVVEKWSRIALYKYFRYQWFNLQLLLEATSTTPLMLRMCHGCVNTVNITLSQPIRVALYLTVTHSISVLDCHALYMFTWLSRTLYVYLTVTHSICLLDCHALYMFTWLSRTLPVYVYLTVTHSICVLDCHALYMCTCSTSRP